LSSFRHGVASGDPQYDRVVIWTRLSGATEDRRLEWTVARDPELKSVVASDSVVAAADADFTAQVDVNGLSAATHYWYAFVDPSTGERSTIGRTRTLGEDVEHLRFAAVSCAKFNAGYFNAYARIAERNDLDFLLHLGDYIYEAAQKPPATQTPGADIGRPFDPLNECVTLTDYRTRYAQYHSDPDVQAFHAQMPMIGTVDDHEFADGAWRAGSDNHVPERDGPWEERKAAAIRARREWLPQRLVNPDDPTRFFRSVRFGHLADLFMIDTRSRRDQPVAGDQAHDPSRTQLGHEQKAWLFSDLDGSTARWRLLGNASVLSQTWTTGIRPELRDGLTWLKMMSKDGGPDPDQWDGYPAERSALLSHLEGRDAIVLSGDVHVGLAIELHERANAGREPIAPEFVTTSITSQNLDDKMKWGYRKGSLPAEREMLEQLPSIKWCDFDSHGYMLVDVTPERVQVEFWFVDEVLHSVRGEHLASSWVVRPGSPHIERLT
jgi:phosphodiesterase/alkaline phosphatase D-like protein